MTENKADEMNNYEKLYLGKEEMIQVIDNAYQDIKQSDMNSKKLQLGVMAIKGLVRMTDEATLNLIWNEIIKFTDYLRTKNALKSEKRLELLKNIQDIKEINDKKHKY